MSLKIWLPLNGDIKNYGASEFTTTLIGSLSSVSGKTGAAYRFDNGNQTGNGISLNTNLVGELGNNFSIACWVNPYGNHVHYNGTIFSSGNWNNQCWAFGLSQDNSKIDVFGNRYNTWMSCSIPTNTWTHLVCVNNNGTCSVYKNGEFVGTGTASSTIASDASNCCVGRETYASGYFGFNGAIQDLRVYDHCLSAAEVKEISQALVLHYPLRDDDKFENQIVNSYSIIGGGNSSGLTSEYLSDGSMKVVANGGNWRYCLFEDNEKTVSNFQNNIAGGDKLTISYDLLIESGTLGIPTMFLNANNSYAGFTSEETLVYGKWIRVHQNRTYATVTDTSYSYFSMHLNFGSLTGTYYVRAFRVEHGTLSNTFWVPSNSNGYLGDNLIAHDCSGYNRNGTSTASTCPTLVTSGGRYSYCYQFDGTDDLITTSFTQNDILPDKKFTISAWINLAEWKNYRGVFGPHDTGGNIRGIFFCQCDEHEIHFGFGNGSSWLRVRDSGYTLGTWAHYVMTYDGTKEIVYRNGTKVGEVSGSIVFDTGTITLGRAHINSGSINRYWKGMISDFRIYATALSADDAARLYKTSASIDKNKRLHCYELENDRDNIFTSENLQRYAKALEGAYGQWTTRNSVPAITMQPHIFYYGDDPKTTGVLKDYFQQNTQYKFDMYIDSDDVVYNNNNVPGGFTIYYTDGSTDSTFVVTGSQSNPKGFQHKILITPSNKSVKGIGLYYYTSIPVYYRAGSIISPISNTSIKKNGIFKDGYTVEIDDTVSVNKGGFSQADSIIEI